MYTEFYGFSERPFDVSPDPKFLYLTESHRETLASMLYGIKREEGLSCGDGRGRHRKNYTDKCLAQQPSTRRLRPVHIFRKCSTFQELLRTILYELGVPPQGQGPICPMAAAG